MIAWLVCGLCRPERDVSGNDLQVLVLKAHFIYAAAAKT